MAGDPGAVGGDDECAAAAGRLHLRGALLGWVLGRVTTPVSNSGEPFFYPSSRVGDGKFLLVRLFRSRLARQSLASIGLLDSEGIGQMSTRLDFRTRRRIT